MCASPPGEATYLEYVTLDCMVRDLTGHGFSYYYNDNWLGKDLKSIPLLKLVQDAERTGAKAAQKERRKGFVHMQHDPLHRLWRDIKGAMNDAGAAGRSDH